MAVHARTLRILVERAGFAPETAFALAEAMDNAMQESQLATVPILDSRLLELHGELAFLRRDMNAGFADSRREMDARFAEAKREMDARFAEARREMDARFVDSNRDMGARLVGLQREVDARFSEMDHKLDSRLSQHKSEMLAWTFAMMVALFAALVGVKFL